MFQNKIDLREKLIDKWILNKKSKKGTPISRQDNEYFQLINWLLPSVNYNYKELTWDNFLSNMKSLDKVQLKRAGIIPVVKLNDVNYWLLGSFHDYEKAGLNNYILTDFGGTCEKLDLENEYPILKSSKNEYSNFRNSGVLKCALREAHEESLGLLNSALNDALMNAEKNVTVFLGENNNENILENIYFFIIEVKYELIVSVLEEFPDLEKKKRRLRQYNRKKKVENYGPIGLYKQDDIRARIYRTSKNLTDFISFLNSYKL
jgi:hypothetical protein